MYRVLIVEDDHGLNQALCYALEKAGYQAASAFSIAEAKELYRADPPDLILLDVNLPDGEGYEFCRWAKAAQPIPVIFLSARDLEEDLLRGYDLGAEDYITKPFSMKILLKKMDVILKRISQAGERTGNYVGNYTGNRAGDYAGNPAGIFDDGYLRVDQNRAKVTVDGSACTVTPTEFRMLKEFIAHEGQLLTYEILLERLWDSDGQFVDKHTLAVNINRLRRKIEDEEHRYISNVYGMGYQWIGRE